MKDCKVRQKIKNQSIQKDPDPENKDKKQSFGNSPK